MVKKADRKLKKLSPLLILLAVLAVAAGGVIYSNIRTYDPGKVNDLPGQVLGDNPRNIPESKLPECQAGGLSGHTVVPDLCYAPPGFIII